MSTLNKELVFLILQFLDEEGLKGAAHMLENETGLYFNMEFFEEMLLNGHWDEAEKYLAGFTKLDDNRYSTKIFFEVRKQKFLEALDKNERAKALDILMKDLKVFAPDNEVLFKEMTQLLTLNDIRENDSLSLYGDTESARKILTLEVKKVIEANPLLHDKLKFPSIRSQRLRRLINQGLNWQHIHCTHPQPNPNISTLFVDHVCLPPEDQLLSTSSDNNLVTTSMTAPKSPASSISTPSTVSHSEIWSGTICLGGSTNLDGLKTNGVSENFPSETSNEETSAVSHPGESFLDNANDFSTTIHPDQNILRILDDLPESPQKNNSFESHRQISNTDLPKNVARILTEASSPMSMDFHPVKQTILLVGTNMGDIGLWKVSSGEKLLSRNFKVWDIGACSMKFKTAFLKDPCVSVNCIAWSPEGSLFGAAYSKHIVQLYSYAGLYDVQQQMEIDAHVGGVNDLAFSAVANKLLVITCGDDKMIKVWDVTTGVRMYSFEGHDSAVYSICPHSKENIHFIFSTSVDGHIKAWLYDNCGARVDIDAPGLGRTSLAYNADDRRLFSCGTNKCGESFLVEWNESEGTIKRVYSGLQKNSLAVVQFDIMKNQFLAAGDEHVIKIWDMDKVDLFSTIDADGGLPANPCIRFNKDGTLLAVFANENRIKILATDRGLQLQPISENCSVDASRVLSDTFMKLAIHTPSTVSCAGIADEALTNWESKGLEAVKCEFTGKADRKLFEINKPSQCRTLWLPSSYVKANKISKLVYNNAGDAILALVSNGILLFWKWQLTDLNASGKATTEVLPQQCQPKCGSRLMINDLTGTKYEETLPCFALSKNDSYLMSASGGKISLFNLMTFKKMLCIMPPPPATTSLAFLPQDNNIVAIGSDDSTILIYNVRLAKVIRKLEGHSKRVSSVAFSEALNVLVSSGADSQILVWNIEGWEKHRSRFLEIPDKKKPVALLDTHIQFHQDQTQFLAVNERRLTIYEARNLECLKEWGRGDLAPISQATFSCDSQMVYASFVDGSVSIFGASHLQLLCRITSTAYLPVGSRDDAYPLVIAAHPQKPNQFTVGLSNGGVIVFEPLNPTGKWSTFPPYEDGSAGAMTVESDNDDCGSSQPDFNDFRVRSN